MKNNNYIKGLITLFIYIFVAVIFTVPQSANAQSAWSYPSYDFDYSYPSYDFDYSYPSYSNDYSYPSYSNDYSYASYDYDYSYPSYSNDYSYASYDYDYSYPSYDYDYSYASYNYDYSYPSYDYDYSYPSYDYDYSYPSYDYDYSYPSYDYDYAYASYDYDYSYPSYDYDYSYPSYDYDYAYASYDYDYSYPSYDYDYSYPSYDYDYSYPDNGEGGYQYPNYDNYVNDYPQDYNDYGHQAYNYPSYDYPTYDYPTYDYPSYDYTPPVYEYDYPRGCTSNCDGPVDNGCTRNCNPVEPEDLDVICRSDFNSIDEGERVTFTAYVDGGDTPYEYYWSGPNGIDGNNRVETFRFNREGRYEVEVTVVDDEGRSESAVCPIVRVNDEDVDNDDLDVICRASDTRITEGETVTFTADVNGGEAPYEYDWSGDVNGNERRESARFNREGRYTATITVTDDNGDREEDECTIVVEEERNRDRDVDTRVLSSFTTPELPQGQVASVDTVFLNQVPSTGANDPLKIFLYAIGLILWSLAVVYWFANQNAKKSNSKRIDDFKKNNLSLKNRA